MRFPGSAFATVLLAALPAACSPPSPQAAGELQLRGDGVGPLTLGANLEKSAAQAKRFDPGALPITPGCDGRNEFTMRTRLLDIAVMAMADTKGRIEEIIVQPDSAPVLRTTDGDTCFRQAKAFASRFSNELGPHTTGDHVQKATTIEHTLNFPGGQRIKARWFRGGGNCDFALHITRDAD